MRKWKGLDVPVEPEKDWQKWMMNPDAICHQGTKDNCEVIRSKMHCKGSNDCRTCIYSYMHGKARKSFYEKVFNKKEIEMKQARDSRGRFIKKADPEYEVLNDELQVANIEIVRGTYDNNYLVKLQLIDTTDIPLLYTFILDQEESKTDIILQYFFDCLIGHYHLSFSRPVNDAAFKECGQGLLIKVTPINGNKNSPDIIHAKDCKWNRIY